MAERLGITITKHIMETQRKHFPTATGDFSGLLTELSIAGKVISRAVNKAGLVDVLGKTGDVNVQGEEVQKLDDFADTVIYQKMDHTGYLCGMASEEVDEMIEIPDKHPQGGSYTLAFDPLDGSSNIDVNVNIGTIFSIHRRISPHSEKGRVDDFLQVGSKQVGAGYIIYGSSTMMVYSAGAGVHGFTLDPSIGEFLLSHPDIKMPANPLYYSVNEGNRHKWDGQVQKMIDYFKTPKSEGGAGLGQRYIGSLVADFHRNLLKGGIFMYPAEAATGAGKLRLLYEASPLAFLAEQAGGAAIVGAEDVLDIQPTELHQRVPLYIGCKEGVGICREYLTGKR